VQITTEQLKELLLSHRGASAVSIVARTVPSMFKTGNPLWGNVCKITRRNGMLGANYTRSVNRQRGREGRPTDRQGRLLLFSARPRRWGNHVGESPLIEHKGKLYLDIKVERTLELQYRTLNPDAVIARHQVEKFTAPRSTESSRQQVHRQIVLRDYTLENILELRMGGEIYQVVNPPPAKPLDLKKPVTKAQLTALVDVVTLGILETAIDQAGGVAAFIDVHLADASDGNRRRTMRALESRIEKLRRQQDKLTRAA
jgi:hypothetical protein